MADTTKTDWTKTKIDWGSINNIIGGTTTLPVLCKDGTYDFETNSPNARIDNSKTCINKGGRAEIKQIEATKVLCNDGTFDIQAREPSIGMGKVAMACKNKGGVAKNQPTPLTQGNKTKEPLYYILVTAGVLVAGYFAYKKFKK